MTVRARIIAIKLSDKIKNNPELTAKTGLKYELNARQKNLYNQKT